MINHKPFKYYCDYCGDPVSESLIMVDGFLGHNLMSCANCTDCDHTEHEPQEYEDDYDQ